MKKIFIVILIFLSSCDLVYSQFNWWNRPETEDLGYYLTFDGIDDYVQLTNVIDILSGGWTLFSKGAYNTDNSTAFLFGGVAGNNILLKHGDYLSYRSNSSTYYDFTTTFLSVKDVLQNYAWVCNGTTIKLYINGVLQDEITPDQTRLYLAKFILGYTTNSNGCKGDVEVVQFYNRELNQTEITTISNGDVISSGLILHYNQFSINGSTWEDLSTSNNDGTINGAITNKK